MADAIEVLAQGEICGRLLEDDGVCAVFEKSVALGVAETIRDSTRYPSMIPPGEIDAAVAAGKAWRPFRSAALIVKENVASAILEGREDSKGVFRAGVASAVRHGVTAWQASQDSQGTPGSKRRGRSLTDLYEDM